MSGSGLILLLILAALIWFWQNSLYVRELALRAAQEICLSQRLQLLDATVTLQRMVLRRSVGRLLLHRTFQFSYSSDGGDRNTGFVIVAGNHVEQVGL